MTPKVVVGKHIGFWQAMSPGMKLFIFGAPTACIVLAVRSFVGGDAAWGGIYAFAAVVVALVARTFWGDAKRTSDIVSACPVCGVERQRQFIAWRNEQEPPSSCGACIVYLRVNRDSLLVREEAIDATDGVYVVTAAQYQSAVPRSNNEDRRYQFVMPTMCAVCGHADAPLLRTLSPMSTPDAGFLGDVASEVANQAFDAKASRNYSSNTLSSGTELDLQLRDVEMHVCAKHTATTDRGVEYSDGDLVFCTYRYYKAFCELNHITATKTAAEGPPTARVVA